MAVKKKTSIYQLHIALEEIRPLIWRRLQVPSDLALPKFHRALQIAMGWQDCHVHEFRFEGRAYGTPDPEDHNFGRDVADERRVRLNSVLSAAGSFFEYIYDFGDNWRHSILLEAILPVTPRKRYPVCVGGVRSAPPEDVGGIAGYEKYLQALSDPQHPQNRDVLQWRGRFDPEFFAVTRVNRELRERFSPDRPQTATALRRNAGSAPATFAEEFDRITLSLIHAGRLPCPERIRVRPDEQVPLPLESV